MFGYDENKKDNEEKELDWDAAIERDAPEYILLPEGDYDFTVTKFERARHSGSAKLPACNKAILYLSIISPEGEEVIVQHQLFLHTKTESMLSAFFTAIGQKKRGEKATMNWNAVTGAKGRCKIYVDTWIGNDGSEKKSNKVRRFYEPAENNHTVQQSQFTPGRF